MPQAATGLQSDLYQARVENYYACSCHARRFQKKFQKSAQRVSKAFDIHHLEPAKPNLQASACLMWRESADPPRKKVFLLGPSTVVSRGLRLVAVWAISGCMGLDVPDFRLL